MSISNHLSPNVLIIKFLFILEQICIIMYSIKIKGGGKSWKQSITLR